MISELGGVPVKRLLARKPHGAVYQVAGPDGHLERLEEIQLPEGFADQARVEAAVRQLTGPSLPPGMRLVFWHNHAYLAYPELKGNWLETRLRWSDQPVKPEELQDWALQVVMLVERLLPNGHPLAVDCLRPDGWFLTAEGKLVLADPGIDRLIWGEAAPLTDAMQAFAALLQRWSGDSTANLWVILRCSSSRPYPDFTSLRQALEERPRVVAGEGEYRSGKPVLEGFVIPMLPPRLQRVTPIVLAVLAVVSLLGLSLWGWLSRPPAPRTQALAAVLRGDRLQAGDNVVRLPGPATAVACAGGRIYLPVGPQILMINDHTLELWPHPLATDGPASRLDLSSDGRWMYATLAERAEVMVFALPDQAAALVPLPSPESRVTPGDGQVLITDPRSGTLELRDAKAQKELARAELACSGPALFDGGSWWVASGDSLVRLDENLREKGRRKLGGRILEAGGGLALWEGGLSGLQGDQGRVEGTPVGAVRAPDGSCWVATHSPDRLLHLSYDLDRVLESHDLDSAPTGIVWLP